MAGPQKGKKLIFQPSKNQIPSWQPNEYSPTCTVRRHGFESIIFPKLLRERWDMETRSLEGKSVFMLKIYIFKVPTPPPP